EDSDEREDREGPCERVALRVRALPHRDEQLFHLAALLELVVVGVREDAVLGCVDPIVEGRIDVATFARWSNFSESSMARGWNSKTSRRMPKSLLSDDQGRARRSARFQGGSRAK